MRLIHKTVSFASPAKGAVAYENSYYTRQSGLEKMRLRSCEVLDDIRDHGIHSFSSDNGQTWPQSRPFAMSEKTPKGTVRRYEATGFVDPVNGYLLHLIYEGLLPNDDNLEGLKSYYLKYRVSADGGKTTLVEDRLIQHGDYTPEHPFEYIWAGKNALLTAAENAILRTPDGHLVVVTNFNPLGEDGEYRRPEGIHSYMEVLVLFGKWQADGRIEWHLGPRISLDPTISSRGASEPTIALMPDNRILMVLRGGNDGSPELQGRKWYCVSADSGATWSELTTWLYADGSSFFSPGSLSQLLPHSSGKIYWLGNICPANPQGNRPRYPLVIGEVDLHSLLLIKNSILEIDTLQPGEHPSLALSNFCAHEDRATGDILLHCTRMFMPTPTPDGWHGDAHLYHIEP